ncbi:MAG TPA: Clp protease N-terminal domain-containing protein [Arthrobacter sp.]
MFERFTADARQAVVLAQEEARALSHNYVGTEHLLLALTRDSGIAGRALTGLDVTRDAVREQVMTIIGPGFNAPMGHIPFTPDAKKVLELAFIMALNIGHNYIGAEHLGLALCADRTSVSGQAMLRCGVATKTAVDRIAELMIEALASGPAPVLEAEFVLSA